MVKRALVIMVRNLYKFIGDTVSGKVVYETSYNTGRKNTVQVEFDATKSLED